MEHPDDLAHLMDAARASPEIIGYELADLVTNLLRDSLVSQPGSNTVKAMRGFIEIVKLVRLLPPESNLRPVFDAAVRALSVEPGDASHRDEWIEAAKAGTRFHLENISGDGYSAARRSDRYRDFVSAVRHAQTKDGRAAEHRD